MWNKQQDEELLKSHQSSVLVSEPVAVTPVKNKKEVVSSMPEKIGGSATIGKAVKINGQIHSKEDLYVDSDIEGTIECPEHKLTIGPNGTVHATVTALEVVAMGTIQGNVEAAERIEIRKDAKLVGDIRTARIVIEDGAYFKGNVDITKPESTKHNMPRPIIAVQSTADKR